MVSRHVVAWSSMVGLWIGGCGFQPDLDGDFADVGEANPVTTASPTTSDGDGEDAGDTDEVGSSTGDLDSTGAADEPPADDTTTTTGDDDDDDTTGGSDQTMPTDDDGVCPTQLTPCDHLTDEPLHALGLDCTSMGDAYVNKVNAAELSDLEFMAAPPMFGKQPWQVARSYGTHVEKGATKPFWGAREGKKLLILSTGLLPPPNDNGAVLVPTGDVYNDVAYDGVWDSDELPPPMSWAEGSPDPGGFADCDGHGDCSNTLLNQWVLGGKNPDDKLWFQFKLTAPPQTRGFAVDFALFSAEFPEYVGSGYNDVLVIWQASESYTGNIAFLDGRPITTTAVWPIDYVGQCPFDDDDCVGKDPHLAGTGYIEDGGATGWYSARSGIHPGETFLLAFAIFDMGDSNYDTTALLDNFRWDCDGCDPNDGASCGVDPQ